MLMVVVREEGWGGALGWMVFDGTACYRSDIFPGQQDS